MPGDAGASGTSCQGEDSSEADDQKYLARAVRGHFGDGTLPRAQRHGDPEILSQRLETGAAQAVSRPAGPALEELEIFDGGHHRARAVEEIPGRVSGDRQAHLDSGGAMECGAGRSQM